MNPLKAISGWFSEFFKPQRYWTGGGRVTTSKENVSEETALNHSAVWAATRLLCGTGARLPLPVYRGIDNLEEREKAREHPVHRLLNRSPNWEMTAFNFRSILWQHQMNFGNGFAEIRREGSDPSAPLMDLWPIDPARVQVCRDDQDELYYKVKDHQTGQNVELESWQVLHIPSIITHDGIVGRGVVQHARESIGAGLAAEKYGAHQFVSGVPQAVVQTEGTWQPEARAAFRQEWSEIYGGADKSRIALLQGNAKLTPLNFSPEDSQFLESRQFGIEEISRWFGVPPHLIGDLRHATFSNIEHQAISYVRYSLIPWLEVWEQCIWQKLFTEAERETYFVEHNVDGLLRGDSVNQTNVLNMQVNAALRTRNEARKELNLPPVAGGDTFLTQGANVPLDENGKPESEFATGSQTATLPDDSGDNNEDVIGNVIARLERVLENDLSRLLTKESKAIQTAAKKPDQFIAKADEFYSGHEKIVRDATWHTLQAFSECGLTLDEANDFVAEWIASGKQQVLEAAGNAKASELPETIKTLTESTPWTERPAKAVEGMK